MKMPTDHNLDVLQNLEASIVQIYCRHPEMTDYTALRVYEAAFRFYRAEQRGHAASDPPEFQRLDAAAYESVKATCEYRLGRTPCPVDGSEPIPGIPLDKLLDCLRELVRSVDHHTKSGGRQGYLTFVKRFLP
jgi:hypothetical protein